MITPSYVDDGVTLYTGDAFDVISELPDASVDCVVTSPPYWGLRDYFANTRPEDMPAGKRIRRARESDKSSKVQRSLRDYRVPGQHGAEPTVDAYVASLVGVFDEVARVLTEMGTVWLNLADTFGGSWGNYIAPGSTATTSTRRSGWRQGSHRPPQTHSRPKDLQGVPWRVAFALMDSGWWLRNAIVWEKPNARPRACATGSANATRLCSC